MENDVGEHIIDIDFFQIGRVGIKLARREGNYLTF